MGVAIVLCEVGHHSVEHAVVDWSGSLIIEVHNFLAREVSERMGEFG